jgi:hypothetical protein
MSENCTSSETAEHICKRVLVVTRTLVVTGLSYYGLGIGSPVGVGGCMRKVGSTD